MATVYVTMGQLYVKDGVALFHGDSVRHETITSGATTQSGALVAGAADPGIRFEVAKIECATPVIATTKAAATTTNGTRVAPDVPEYIVVNRGARVSVIDQ